MRQRKAQTDGMRNKAEEESCHWYNGAFDTHNKDK